MTDIEWVREGFSLLDIKSDDELVLCDRVPSQNQLVKPGERMGKLIFKRRIIDDKGNLLEEIKRVIKGVYEQYRLLI